MAGMNNGFVETAPFVDANTISDRLGSDSEHGRVVADEDDAASRGDCSFDDADDVGNRQASEQRPHGEILEPGWRGRELIAQSIVFHVDAYQVIESRSREAQDA